MFSFFKFLSISSLLVLIAAPCAICAEELPDGPGKVQLQRICSACHAPEIVVGRHETKARWDELVSSMAEKGAVGSDEEFNQIVEYLAKNFGKTAGDTKDAAPDPKQ